MTKADDRRRRKQPELTSLDSAFEPQPVTPEEGRRRDPAASNPAPRAIVELTSPIGHRLRVPASDGSGDPGKPKG
jgi:hypothetical protein